MNLDSWLQLVLTIIGSAGFGAFAVKLLQRPVDQATASKIRTDAADIAVEAMRGVLGDVISADARKAEKIEALEQRIDKLEERERHMLTRAAVHEAWDRMAFNHMLRHDASFPEPPPLSHDPPGVTASAYETDDN